MTKFEIIDRISDTFGLSEKKARWIVNTVFEAIIQGTARDGTSQFRGLGIFHITETRPRKAHNPKTKAVVDVPARRSLRFRQSSTVVERLNGAAVKANGSGG